MLLRPISLLAAAAALFTTPVSDHPAEPALLDAPAPLGPEQLCAGDPACMALRWVEVDLDALGLDGLSGRTWMAYDLDEVLRPLPYEAFEGEAELSLAVRLVLSEVGADRLLMNQNGLLEAIGILYTVENRLNPFTSNPARFPRYVGFPGCGPGGDFVTCANAAEYIGMDTWRATNPRSRYREPMLTHAADLAVLAWFLQSEGLVADPTGRATSYVHRCGGAAYGLTTWHCDGTNRKGIRDVRGANPVTGPTVFKRPVRAGKRRSYQMRDVTQIDYVALPAGQPHLARLALSPWTPEGGDALVAAD